MSKQIQKIEDHRAANEQAAKIFMADTERYGSEESAYWQYSRLVLGEDEFNRLKKSEESS